MTANAFDIFDEVFGDVLRPAAPQPEHERTPDMAVGANEKLSRNLDLALDRQSEILSQPITPQTSPRDKRLSADVAHNIVRAAVSVGEQKKPGPSAGDFGPPQRGRASVGAEGGY